MTTRFENVWDAIEKTPALAANMKLRAGLMMALTEYIRETGSEPEPSSEEVWRYAAANFRSYARAYRCLCDRYAGEHAGDGWNAGGTARGEGGMSRQGQAKMESAEAIGAVDKLLAGVGLTHGRRLIRRETPGFRRQEPAELKETPATELATHRDGRVEVLVAPRWRKAGVPHAFSTRRGGVSTVYSREENAAGEMNLAAR